MNRNFQPGIHPDADQLSLFVEGGAAEWEHERMLTHLAECAECRKAVFLMQPHEEKQRVTAAPAKGWLWRPVLTFGLPAAAAFACGLIAVLVYIRPHGVAPRIPQQIASVKQPEIEHPGTTVVPPTNSDKVSRSRRPQDSFAQNAETTGRPRQQGHIASSLNSPTSKRDQAKGDLAVPTTMGAAPSAPAQYADEASALAGNNTVTTSELPLNGRNFTDLEQLSPPAATQGAAAQNSLANKKELPALEIERPRGKDETLAGISGRITDRSGAIIPGATITLRDAAGETRQTTTGGDGSFHLTELPAGRYELTATASGFKANKQLIELRSSELAQLKPVLDVGAASEEVLVEAESRAASVETESANSSVQVVAETGRITAIPSGLPVRATVSHGKRVLSLDDAGNLFLSHNGGKKWKKVSPQWASKAVRLELTPSYSTEAPPRPKSETLARASEGDAVFSLTTDVGTVWTSKDGKHWHWHQQ